MLGRGLQVEDSSSSQSSSAPLQDGTRQGLQVSPKMMCQHQQHLMSRFFVF